MSIENTITTIKKHPAIVLLLLIIAIVGGAATFFTSLEDIYSLATKYFSSEETPQIRATSIALASEEASNKGLELNYGRDDSEEYALILNVNAKFKADKFNTPVYLHSISELKIESNDLSENRMFLRRNYLQSKPGSKQMEWWAFLVFEKKPVSSRNLSITLGPLKWDIPIGKQIWSPVKYRHGATQNNWYRAQGRLELSLPDPTWPVIRSARLLESNRNNQSLLEVVIENRSEESIPIDTIVVSASHPKDPGTACAFPDRKQSLTLNWGVIASEEVAQSAWTEISDTNVKVPVRYNGRGVCSSFSFLAAVPVSSTINGKSIGRISLNILELPPANRPANGSRGIMRFLAQSGSNSPQSVLRWLDLKIGINATKTSRPVFPSVVNVERGQNNDMLLDFGNKNLTKP